MRHGGFTRALVLALAVHVPLPAPAAGEAQGAPAASQRPPLPRGKRSGLEARVARLTRALGLDARQQDALRTLLRDQREQVQRIWRDESVPPADRVAATRSVSLRTADRIRAMLSESQRRRYDPPPLENRERTIRDARVEDWMKVDGNR